MPKPERPTRTPKQLLAALRMAEHDEREASAELQRETRFGGKPDRVRGLKERHGRAVAALKDRQGEHAAGMQAWDAYHAAEEEERVAAETARHRDILRHVHRDRPEFLRELGIEPEPVVVEYPPEAPGD